MTTQLSDTQRRVKNEAEFRRKLSILHKAAIGVVLCRTREPYRAIRTIRDFAVAEKTEYKKWDILTGWQTFNADDPSQPPTSDNQVEPVGALRAINGIGNQEGFPNGFYAMFYPHYMLPKSPAMIQCVKEYARLFPENKKRLIIVTPPIFTLPPELEDDVVIPAYTLTE